jgi:uncharacterized protein (TIGR02271 family)
VHDSHHDYEVAAMLNPDSFDSNHQLHFQLLEEQLDIRKRTVLDRYALIRKVVETRYETIQVPIRVETIVVEYCEVDACDTDHKLPADTSITNTEEFVFQLYTEQAVVSKKSVLSETVVVRKFNELETVRIEEHVNKEVLQVEEVLVENRRI